MEELEKKVAELEGKLEKARTMYKEQKAELDKANATIKSYEESVSPSEETYNQMIEGYKARIKELEDEITINGSSAEEIKTLTARLEKAKNIFTEQKTKIKGLEDKVEVLSIEKSTLEATVTSLTETVTKISEIINRFNK